MKTAHRMSLILALSLMLPGASALAAQQVPAGGAEDLPPAAAEPAAPEEAADAGSSPGLDGHQVRSELTRLLADHPGDLGAVLGLDPTLVRNEELLARYPEVERFVAQHPQVRRNPHFFLAHFRERAHGGSGFEEVLEGLAIFATFGLVALALGWFIRTVIEQRRWSRLAHTQNEVHNKILDRFDSREQLLAYIQSPAGARFLESAPIPLQTERRETRSPVSRALWPVQVGVVLLAAAVGLLVVAGRFEAEAAEGFFALGVIGLSIGIGFLGSAAVSIWLSRRLGLWEGPAAPAVSLDDSDVVR